MAHLLLSSLLLEIQWCLLPTSAIFEACAFGKTVNGSRANYIGIERLLCRSFIYGTFWLILKLLKFCLLIYSNSLIISYLSLIQ